MSENDSSHALLHDEDETGNGGYAMYLNVDVVNVVLFRSWKTKTWQELLLACLFAALVSFTSEFIVAWRDYLYWESTKSHSDSKANPNGESKTKEGKLPDEKTRLSEKRNDRCGKPNYRHIVQTMSHFVQVCLTLMIMLLAMTFNVYICLAIAIGRTVGYFFFGWMVEDRFKRSTKQC